MDLHDERIPDEAFATFLDTMPQTSVEIVVEYDESVLLVKRTNEPAKGEWFWPGTRLYKGEPFEHAVQRLASEELGIEVEVVSRLGVYNHFWEMANLPGVASTHTVNVVYHVQLTDGSNGISGLVLDDQHDGFRFIDRIEPTFHEYVTRYLDDSEILD